MDKPEYPIQALVLTFLPQCSILALPLQGVFTYVFYMFYMNQVQKHACVLGTGLALGAILFLSGAQISSQDIEQSLKTGALVSSSAFLPISSPETPERVVETIGVVVTAYSSSPWETDDTPYITASGTQVRQGIVAANFLPMGTKIKLPDLYGDEVFVVEDRMHPRKNYQIDIWFSSYWDALNFGAKHTYIEVLEG